MDATKILKKSPQKSRSKSRPEFFSAKKIEAVLPKKANQENLKEASSPQTETATPGNPTQKIIRRDPKKEQSGLKPAFKKVKKSAKDQKFHEETPKILSETKAASILPSARQNDLLGKTDKVNTTAEKEPKAFDKSSFEKNLKISIDETIKKASDARKIKEQGGVNPQVSSGIVQTVNSEKDQSGGEFKTSVGEKPAVPSDEKVQVEPSNLDSQKIAEKSKISSSSILTPPERPKSDTDLSQESKSIDLKMAENEVTTEQLENSEEPSFVESANSKKTAQTKAKNFGKEYGATEAQNLAKNKKENLYAANSGVQNMNAHQSSAQINTSKNQKETKQKELLDKTTAEIGLLNIYATTENEVASHFKKIDDHIAKEFTNSLNSNLEKFYKEVSKLIDDNDGIDWLGKKLTGQHVQSETEIFNIAKDNFVKNMAAPVSSLVKVVDENLTQAKNSVTTGRSEIDKFWKGLSGEEKKNAELLKSKIDGQYSDLESSIDEKEKNVVETVTEKFSEALEKLDSLFEKALEENKSWLAKAADAIAGAINTIIELGKTLKRIASKAGKYISRIMAAPGKFFDNLSNGIGQGFTNFKNRIDQHLIKGVLSWLTGSMREMNIVLPENYDFQGIVGLIMQILGISVEKVKKIIENIIGKKQYEFLQKGVEKGMAAGNRILEIFQILSTEGISGLWIFIKLEFGNLKEMLIDTAKSFVIEAITKKATAVLLSLLIPGAGFIRAAELLIRFVTTLFQKAAEIMRIIEGVIDTFGDILENNVAKAAEKVENVLGGFISLAISFLAGVLGLNGIAQKVQKFIQEKIQPKVEKVLNKIGETIKMVLDKLGITKLIDKAMSGAEKGKAWIDDKKQSAIATGKAVGGKILEFLGFKKRFKLGNGELHTLQFDDKNGAPEFYVHSTPTKYSNFINSVNFENDFDQSKPLSKNYGGKNPKETSRKAGNVVDSELGKYESTSPENRKKWGDNIVIHMNNIAEVIEHYSVVSNNESEIPSIVEWGGTNSKGLGKKVVAKQLSSNYVSGQETSEDGEGKGLTPEWDVISRNKGANSTYYYVRGHLLNAKVGGVVNNTNLTPLSRNANKDHLKGVERDAKKLVTGKKSKGDKESEKGAIFYSVEAIYGSHKKRSFGVLTATEQLVKDTEEMTGIIPTQLRYSLKRLKLENKKVVVDSTVEEIKGSVMNELPEKMSLKS